MKQFINNENLTKTSPISNNNWLTIEDVIRILNVSRRTLQSYRDKRLIPYYQVGRKILFKNTDIDDFLERHHVKARYQQKGEL